MLLGGNLEQNLLRLGKKSTLAKFVKRTPLFAFLFGWLS